MDLDDCAVCLEPMVAKALKTPCTHIFHEHCLETWFKTGTPGNCCPLCKQSLRWTEDGKLEIPNSSWGYRDSNRNSPGFRTFLPMEFLLNGFQTNELDLIQRFLDLLCHDEPAVRMLAVLCFVAIIFGWLAILVFAAMCVTFWAVKASILIALCGWAFLEIVFQIIRVIVIVMSHYCNPHTLLYMV